MRKKALLIGCSITAAFFMTACSRVEEVTPEKKNMEQEVVQQRNDFAGDEVAEEENTDTYYNEEEICDIYYSYLINVLSGDELEETLASTFEGMTVERAKEIFEESGELYGYEIYEPNPEILNANVSDPMIQIGDTVIHFPCKFGDFMQAVNGEFGDQDEAASTDRVMDFERSEYSLDTDFQTLDTLGNSGDALVKTSDGSFLKLWISGEDETIQSAKDMYVTQIITGSSNVFLPGGVRIGMSMQEMDDLFKGSENEFDLQIGWHTLSGPSYLSKSFENSISRHRLYFHIDAEKNELWYMEISNLPKAGE